jgi:hypothetical protein
MPPEIPAEEIGYGDLMLEHGSRSSLSVSLTLPDGRAVGALGAATGFGRGCSQGR